jgi:hypothetical protein
MMSRIGQQLPRNDKRCDGIRKLGIMQVSRRMQSAARNHAELRIEERGKSTGLKKNLPMNSTPA